MSSVSIGLDDEECEAELRQLITQTLETNGVLPKLRAQLRASVYLALDEDGGGSVESELGGCGALRGQLGTAVGHCSLALVRDWLSTLQLDYTLSVLDAELSGVAAHLPKSPDRQQLRHQLVGPAAAAPSEQQLPVLAELLQQLPTVRRPVSAGGVANGSSLAAVHNGGQAHKSSNGQLRSTTAMSYKDDVSDNDSFRSPAARPEPVDSGSSRSPDDDEDSFFDNLPKSRSVVAADNTNGQPPVNGDPAAPQNGDHSDSSVAEELEEEGAEEVSAGSTPPLSEAVTRDSSISSNQPVTVDLLESI